MACCCEELGTSSSTAPPTPANGGTSATTNTSATARDQHYIDEQLAGLAGNPRIRIFRVKIPFPISDGTDSSTNGEETDSAYSDNEDAPPPYKKAALDATDSGEKK